MSCFKLFETTSCGNAKVGDMATQGFGSHHETIILDALKKIEQGATADSVESEFFEFKEDRAHDPQAKNSCADLIEKVIDEVVCFANSDHAWGYVVIGVADKVPGREAFTGTDMDETDVRDKVFARTKPNLRVEVEPLVFAEKRLLIVTIPEALTLYTRAKGQASKRVGTRCVPLSQEERQAIVYARANPDYMAKDSTHTVEEISLDVVNEARRLLANRRKASGIDPAVPETARGLLRELGLINQDERLRKAADILLLPPPPPLITVRHLWRPFPGADPHVTEIAEPIISALPHIQRLIARYSEQDVKRVRLNGGQEIAIPRLPKEAVDEVITNALVHRDWLSSQPIVVDQSPRVLKVWSPGSLPVGVDKDRLLTTQSVPRNATLMAAMRALGLVEESSRGFDRVWASMIRTGRDVPEVDVTDVSVEVIIPSGTPDTDFVAALLRFDEEFGEMMNSVNVLIVLWHLWEAPIITEKQVMEKTQTAKTEAKELMAALCEYGLTQQIRDAREWVLSERSRKVMGKTEGKTLASVSIGEWLLSQLSDGASISAAEAAEEIGVDRKEITEHLRYLRTLGRARIDPHGPQRGSATRWIAGS
ncbi:MAG: putative DNA binding domain-containing protein [Corynebacterium sp.]|uniref:RNA-binding domain-containing protein n=1 Tax=Corynebacterium sp. TaxID=1720 RepID=UPI0026DD6BE2|nr:RNA-binding domain-containing protein [Corynebacterium sp.]MDO4761165.1 putative DNA binding domain-containing protein [Corynebacterium sp.]